MEVEEEAETQMTNAYYDMDGWIEMTEGDEHPELVNVGIEEELRFAEEYDAHEVVPAERARGAEVESTRWVIRFDDEKGQSIVVDRKYRGTL